RLGQDQATRVEWSSPRLICVAGDLTKYDDHGVNHMDHNIELVGYRRFGEDLLLLELLTSTSSGSAALEPTSATAAVGEAERSRSRHRTVTESLANADEDLTDLFEALKAYLVALGDDVQIEVVDTYLAFR